MKVTNKYIIESKEFNYAKNNINKMKNKIIDIELINNGFKKTEMQSGVIYYDKENFRIQKIANDYICEEFLILKNIDEILIIEKIKNENYR
jgi:hypothetical protein